MFLLVKTLPQVLKVRILRNSCREYLTNYTGQISLLRQLYWYFLFYRQARRTGDFRIYLLVNDDGIPVGYGALQLHDDQLFVTECIAPEFRGQKYGAKILYELLTIASAEKRDVVAEIWADNKPSIALHERVGFQLKSSTIKSNRELHIYQFLVSKELTHAQS